MSTQAGDSASGAKQWEYYTDMPVGEILRRARNHYGQSVEDVAGFLRIRASQLAALEEGRVDQLPGRVYAIGFVRAYSEYLGLDGEKMVQLFKIQSVGAKARPELSFPVPASESKLPGFYILGASLAALVLLVAALLMMGRVEEPVTSSGVPPVPDAVKEEAASPVPDDITAAAIAQQTPAQPVERIVIHVRDNAWVEIRNNSGQDLLSQVLSAGARYIVPDEKGLVLATGNIGGLEFVVDGVAIPPLGARGDVRRGVRLEPEILRPGTTPVVPTPAPTANEVPEAQTPEAESTAPDVTGQISPAPPETQQTTETILAQPTAMPMPAPAPARAVLPPQPPTPVNSAPMRARDNNMRSDDDAFRPVARTPRYN